MSLLQVKNLNIDFSTSQGTIQALRDVNFDLKEGEALGIVGESGSGKSVTSLALFDLLAANAIVRSGEIFFNGRDIRKMSEAEKLKLRGGDISMIFQDPMSSLNPCFTVEYQIMEVLQTHQGLTGQSARDKVLELLRQVGIPDPQSRLKVYPHELSGGMSQRIMIAMAIACSPKVLIADEPTTALDVTIQKQILTLLQKLRKEKKMSLILVSHDLGVIAQNTDRILVMYAGEIVEEGISMEVMQRPTHPYTEGLLKCLPALHAHESKDFRLPTIPGIVPHLGHRPSGCQLNPRCPYKRKNCEEVRVPLQHTLSLRETRCLYPLNTERSLS
jgi:oligopeptide/dipeptide ABC transporter ATP-binding protein